MVGKALWPLLSPSELGFIELPPFPTTTYPTTRCHACKDLRNSSDTSLKFSNEYHPCRGFQSLLLPCFVCFGFLCGEAVLPFYRVFSEMCSTLTRVCLDIELREFPLLLVVMIFLHTIRTLHHKQPWCQFHPVGLKTFMKTQRFGAACVWKGKYKAGD